MSDEPEDGAENNVEQPRLGGITGKGFMPGQSGNPTGRPRGSAKLRELLSPELEPTVDKLLAARDAGEQWAIQEVLNRIGGKPTVGSPGDEGEQYSRIEFAWSKPEGGE